MAAGRRGGVRRRWASRRSGRRRSRAEQVSAFPMPGSPVGAPGDADHPPRRGAPTGSARSRSAARAPARTRARCARTPTAQGASFVPQRPFAAGETVTVRTALDIPGATATATSRSRSRAARRPPPAATARSSSRRCRRRRSTASARGADLEAPVVRINRARARDPEGPDLPRPVLPQGQPAAGRAADHRRPRRPRVVQAGPPRHGGHRPQGPAARRRARDHLVGGPLRGRLGLRRLQGVRPATTARSRAIRPGNGLTSDLHDMQLTDRGTALLLSYDRIKRDLRFVGGVRHGRLLDNVVQEVDLATGPRAVRVAQRRRGAADRQPVAARTARARGTTSTSTPSRRTRTAT